MGQLPECRRTSSPGNARVASQGGCRRAPERIGRSGARACSRERGCGRASLRTRDRPSCGRMPRGEASEHSSCRLRSRSRTATPCAKGGGAARHAREERGGEHSVATDARARTRVGSAHETVGVPAVGRGRGRGSPSSAC
eukprot:6203344-Pleurochrysis_carterae.AAC.1